jgi:catechol 2,3-dioxygenase-like lactoylglutathione lyase family enzyme
VDVLFIASVAVVAADPVESRKLYVGALGLPLAAASDSEYFYSERIDGSKHFGVWPLTQAAQACFGVDEWPPDQPVPQVSVEFEVADGEAVAAAAEELRRRGFDLLHEAREEPWGQTVARLLSPEERSSASRTRRRCTRQSEGLGRRTVRLPMRKHRANPHLLLPSVAQTTAGLRVMPHSSRRRLKRRVLQVFCDPADDLSGSHPAPAPHHIPKELAKRLDAYRAAQLAAEQRASGGGRRSSASTSTASCACSSRVRQPRGGASRQTGAGSSTRGFVSTMRMIVSGS